LQAFDDGPGRQEAVHRQRQFRLEAGGNLGGDAFEQFGLTLNLSRLRHQHAAGFGQHRRLGGSVEQRHALRGLQRSYRLADRRLHPPQLAAGRGEASGIGNRRQHPELVEGQCTQHDVSPFEMEYITI
jgi:hypothetical protein